MVLILSIRGSWFSNDWLLNVGLHCISKEKFTLYIKHLFVLRSCSIYCICLMVLLEGGGGGGGGEGDWIHSEQFFQHYCQMRKDLLTSADFFFA